ncbi:MAG: DUF1249 domain-containing protein [Escherichia coli]|nr:DUF1249 domain-containing protein [Escherichia coli]
MKRYTPDFPEMMRLCEMNFSQLRRLLPRNDAPAEVCSSQQIFRFKARYDYPNKKLHQRDEKHQINQFLADWLRYCLAHGAMAIPVY